MDDAYCTKTGASDYMRLGGMKGMGGAMSRGMVLAMSIWWDEGGFMNWLDSGNAGPCNATEGDPKIIREIEKAPSVIFSQVRYPPPSAAQSRHVSYTYTLHVNPTCFGIHS